MRRRVLPLLAGVLLLWSAPVAHAAPDPGHFTFAGTIHENCYGCGTSNATFDGTLTGFVDGHLYVNATFLMNYTVQSPPGVECVLTGIAAGQMLVYDGTWSSDWDFDWTRAVNAVAATVHPGGHTGSSGAFAATHAITGPIGVPCGGPAEFLMVGSGVVG